MTEERYLNNLNARENLLRAIGAQAKKIEDESNIGVVRLNVGDPTGPTLAASNDVSAGYYKNRTLYTGYTDHAGHPALRTAASRLLNKIGRLPKDTFTSDTTFFVPGGTGGLNVALSIFDKPAVLFSDPSYPSWIPITLRNGGEIHRFDLNADDDFLLNKKMLETQLTELRNIDPNKPIVLLYHYPHNPTGKTLSETEAKETAATLNELVTKFPNLHLIQEDLYLATTRTDLGIHTPLQFLNKKAMDRTIMVHSPSKEGHGQDRGALVTTADPTLAKYLRGATAFDTLGISTAAALATVRTLTDIAKGIDPKPDAKIDSIVKEEENHRYVTADYYQERLAIVGQAFVDIEKALGLKGEDKILHNGIPEGTYYLLPSLKCMKDRAIPKEFEEVFATAVKNGADNISRDGFIHSTHDIQLMLASAHKLGLRPVTTAPGEIFSNPNDDMIMRLATVSKDVNNLHEAANTIKGVIGKVMRLDLGKDGLDVTIRSVKELQENFPPQKQLNRLTDPDAVREKKSKRREGRNLALEKRGGQLIPPHYMVESKGDGGYLIRVPDDFSDDLKKQVATQYVSLLRERFGLVSEVGIDADRNVSIVAPTEHSERSAGYGDLAKILDAQLTPSQNALSR